MCHDGKQEMSDLGIRRSGLWQLGQTPDSIGCKDTLKQVETARMKVSVIDWSYSYCQIIIHQPGRHRTRTLHTAKGRGCRRLEEDSFALE